MSFADIRAHIETRVNDAFQALTPAVPVVFDNVQETPSCAALCGLLDQLQRHNHPHGVRH